MIIELTGENVPLRAAALRTLAALQCNSYVKVQVDVMYDTYTYIYIIKLEVYNKARSHIYNKARSRCICMIHIHIYIICIYNICTCIIHTLYDMYHILLDTYTYAYTYDALRTPINIKLHMYMYHTYTCKCASILYICVNVYFNVYISASCSAHAGSVAT